MKKGRYDFDYSKLYGYMKEKGYTQEKLSKLSGVSIGTINQNLKTGRAFRGENIFDLSRALGMNKEDIGYYFFRKRV